MTQKELTLESTNSVNLTLQGEKGPYILSLPLNSPLSEAVAMSAAFHQTLVNHLKEYEKKVASEKKESEEGEVGKEDES